MTRSTEDVEMLCEFYFGQTVNELNILILGGILSEAIFLKKFEKQRRFARV